MGSERAWLERRLEKALEAEQAACDRAQSLERQCETLDEEVNIPLPLLQCHDAFHLSEYDQKIDSWFPLDFDAPDPLLPRNQRLKLTGLHLRVTAVSIDVFIRCAGR